MTAPLNLVPGQRFGSLTVIRRGENTPAGKARWFCRCDCGANSLVVGSTLRSGRTQSCRDCAATWEGTHGYTRDGAYPAIYRTWCKMRARCYIKSNPDYPHYGGRGIRVCSQWLGPNGFAQFVADMGPRPEGTTIDRIHNGDDYMPKNCRWATRQIQAVNRRGMLTEAQVLALRSDYADGASFRQLAETYRLTPQGARNIALRKTWRHLP